MVSKVVLLRTAKVQSSFCTETTPRIHPSEVRHKF
ncbi:unnamed protein product [Arabidopsis lyrata]|nr:unnamed protein product [Arabidopsis lyrata]